jgi:hypothetical protein
MDIPQRQPAGFTLGEAEFTGKEPAVAQIPITQDLSGCGMYQTVD